MLRLTLLAVALGVASCLKILRGDQQKDRFAGAVEQKS
jgi:hypothetical protein